jgi:hypothetical protein
MVNPVGTAAEIRQSSFVNGHLSIKEGDHFLEAL